MRSHLRTAIVLLVAAGLVALFLRNVDLRRVVADIVHSRPEWLALSLSTAFVSLAVRAIRWRYLLEPLGRTTFGNALKMGFVSPRVYSRCTLASSEVRIRNARCRSGSAAV